MADAVESVLMGTPQTDPFGAASGDIEKAFREMLTAGTLDGLGYPGIPTAASGNGSLRKVGVHPRPSFVDTGNYENSFKAWVD